VKVLALIIVVVIVIAVAHQIGHAEGKRLGSRKGYGVGYDRGKRSKGGQGYLIVTLAAGIIAIATAAALAYLL
jgi:hypothetical protein